MLSYMKIIFQRNGFDWIPWFAVSLQFDNRSEVHRLILAYFPAVLNETRLWFTFSLKPDDFVSMTIFLKISDFVFRAFMNSRLLNGASTLLLGNYSLTMVLRYLQNLNSQLKIAEYNTFLGTANYHVFYQ